MKSAELREPITVLIRLRHLAETPVPRKLAFVQGFFILVNVDSFGSTLLILFMCMYLHISFGSNQI